ncbi:MAG TPA: hypothetical protein VF516_29680 [Kofleriaceae bacterium]
MEFQRLREAWERAHPRRATGGVVSLRGFLYQFQAVVRAWVADPTSVEVVVESVSDRLELAHMVDEGAVPE